MQIGCRKMQIGMKRLTSIGLYILISLFVVGSLFVAVELNIPKDLFLRWFGLVGFTLILFAEFIRKNRPLWSDRSFWVLVGIVIALHLGIFTTLGMIHVNLAGIQLMIIFFVEAILLRVVRGIVFRKSLHTD